MTRTEIVADERFRKSFLEEPIWHRFSGSLRPDDDNFITRWVINLGYDIKIQWSDDATILTTLGTYPRFLSQCLRWARTTYRSNFRSLLIERTVWRRWPWTVWTTLIPSLFNGALVWDASMMYALTRTQMYDRHSTATLLCFGIWIYLTKLVKLAGYFKLHPADFLLFFFPVPAYPLFAYFHTFLKLWAAITFWDGTWAGRT